MDKGQTHTRAHTTLNNTPSNINGHTTQNPIMIGAPVEKAIPRKRTI